MVYKALVHSASFTLVPTHVDTHVESEAATILYSGPMYASVNTEWRACNYRLRGELASLFIIHET